LEESLSSPNFGGEAWNNEDLDLCKFVIARFLTEYALLDRFAKSLVRMIIDPEVEAVLADQDH
jgi:hypothetical protein